MTHLESEGQNACDLPSNGSAKALLAVIQLIIRSNKMLTNDDSWANSAQGSMVPFF